MTRRKDRAPRRAWSDAEVRTLQLEWHQLQYRGLREKLPGRTWRAIRKKARGLGLPLGVPQGSLSLRACAKKLGVEILALQSICAARGVHVGRVYPGDRKRARGRPRARRHVAGRFLEHSRRRRGAPAWAASESPSA